MGQQEALGVLGITDAVIEQVPIQSVRPPIRMTTSTALPALMTYSGIVKKPLPLPL
jgi:hypothetical protein